MSEQRGDFILYVSPLLLHEVRGRRKRLKKIENLKDVGDYKHTQIAHLSVKDWIFHTCEYRIAGKFCGRKPLRISQFCGYSQKFSLRNLELWCPLVQQKRAICESFLHENRIFHQFAKVFSLRSFPLDIPHMRISTHQMSAAYL